MQCLVFTIKNKRINHASLGKFDESVNVLSEQWLLHYYFPINFIFPLCSFVVKLHQDERGHSWIVFCGLCDFLDNFRWRSWTDSNMSAILRKIHYFFKSSPFQDFISDFGLMQSQSFWNISPRLMGTNYYMYKLYIF